MQHPIGHPRRKEPRECGAETIAKGFRRRLFQKGGTGMNNIITTIALFNIIDFFLYITVPFEFRIRFGNKRFIPGFGIHMFTKWVEKNNLYYDCRKVH